MSRSTEYLPGSASALPSTRDKPLSGHLRQLREEPGANHLTNKIAPSRTSGGCNAVKVYQRRDMTCP